MKTPPTVFDALRTIAVSRIYLDNFDHLTACWMGLGLKLARGDVRGDQGLARGCFPLVSQLQAT